MSTHISAIIPVHNGECYLSDALRSVLDQTRPVDEIVVVDDASSDGTQGIIEQFSAEYHGLFLYERLPEQRGAATARNRGVELASGEFLAFLDADDRWTPDKLRLQAERLSTCPTLDMVFGLAQEFISPDLTEVERATIRTVRPLMPGLVPGTLLVCRESFARIGPFASDLTIGEFIHWFARARQANLSYEVISELLLLRRLHNSNLTRRTKEYHDYLRMIKMVLDNKRSRGLDTAPEQFPEQ